MIACTRICLTVMPDEVVTCIATAANCITICLARQSHGTFSLPLRAYALVWLAASIVEVVAIMATDANRSTNSWAFRSCSTLSITAPACVWLASTVIETEVVAYMAAFAS